MSDLDAALQRALFEDVPSRPETQPDWRDVLRRSAEHAPAGRHRRRLALFAAAGVAAVATPALAFHREIVDFFAAPKASPVVVREFRQLEVISRFNRPLGILADRARRVTTVDSGAGRLTLSVAPTRPGGFCAFVTPIGGQMCASRKDARPGSVLATYSYGTDPSGVTIVEGATIDPYAAIRLDFADGSSSDVPVVWVTPPIRAGFFVYAAAATAVARRPTAIVAHRGDRILERIPMIDPAQESQVQHRDRWGRVIESSPEADWSRRRLVVSLNASDGSLVTLYLFPSRLSASRICWSAIDGAGCEARTLAGPPLQLHITGSGRSALLSGRVALGVARVELRFETGASETVHPHSGFVFAELPQAHVGRGHRLVEAIGWTASGAFLGRQDFDPTRPNVYPCVRPKDYGFRVRACP